MGGHKRTVVHALLTYSDENGHELMALRGQEVELGDEELERAERFGAVVEGPLPAAPGAPVLEPVTVALPADPASTVEVTPAEAGGETPGDPDVASSGGDAGGGDSGDADGAPADTAAGGDGPRRPARVEAKGVWVDYAVARGAAREEAEKMTKDQLLDTYAD